MNYKTKSLSEPASAPSQNHHTMYGYHVTEPSLYEDRPIVYIQQLRDHKPYHANRAVITQLLAVHKHPHFTQRPTPPSSVRRAQRNSQTSAQLCQQPTYAHSKNTSFSILAPGVRLQQCMRFQGSESRQTTLQTGKHLRNAHTNTTIAGTPAGCSLCLHAIKMIALPHNITHCLQLSFFGRQRQSLRQHTPSPSPPDLPPECKPDT